MAHAKFKQIALSTVINDQDEIFDTICALDEDGVVWRFSEEDERWEKLASDRLDAKEED